MGVILFGICLKPERRTSHWLGLQMAYEGPFPIVQKFSDIDYRIQFDKKRKQGVVNYNQLQPYMGHSFPS